MKSYMSKLRKDRRCNYEHLTFIFFIKLTQLYRFLLSQKEILIHNYKFDSLCYFLEKLDPGPPKKHHATEGAVLTNPDSSLLESCQYKYVGNKRSASLTFRTNFSSLPLKSGSEFKILYRSSKPFRYVVLCIQGRIRECIYDYVYLKIVAIALTYITEEMEFLESKMTGNPQLYSKLNHMISTVNKSAHHIQEFKYINSRKFSRLCNKLSFSLYHSDKKTLIIDRIKRISSEIAGLISDTDELSLAHLASMIIAKFILPLINGIECFGLEESKSSSISLQGIFSMIKHIKRRVERICCHTTLNNMMPNYTSFQLFDDQSEALFRILSYEDNVYFQDISCLVSSLGGIVKQVSYLEDKYELQYFTEDRKKIVLGDVFFENKYIDVNYFGVQRKVKKMKKESISLVRQSFINNLIDLSGLNVKYLEKYQDILSPEINVILRHYNDPRILDQTIGQI